MWAVTWAVDAVFTTSVAGSLVPRRTLKVLGPSWRGYLPRELCTVDRGRIDDVVMRPGNRRRLRLICPYEEHFAQSFARFYMRVGLPHDASTFEDAGKGSSRRPLTARCRPVPAAVRPTGRRSR